jgi:hypothetical protein
MIQHSCRQHPQCDHFACCPTSRIPQLFRASRFEERRKDQNRYPSSLRSAFPFGAHAGKDKGSGVIKIEQNIAGVAMLGKGQQIDVIPLTVACAPKAHDRSRHQLTRIPKPFSRTRLSRGPMNQAEKVEIIRHGRERRIACEVRKNPRSNADSSAIESPCRYKDFSAISNNPLTSPPCLSPGAVQTAPSPATLPQKPTQSPRGCSAAPLPIIRGDKAGKIRKLLPSRTHGNRGTFLNSVDNPQNFH